MMPTTQKWRSLAAPSFVGGNIKTQTFGTFLSCPPSSTTTRTQYYATDRQRSSYQIDPHQQRLSTVCMSSRRNPNLSAIIMQQPVSQPNQHGWKQSRTSNLCPGRTSWPMQLTSTTQNQRRHTKATAGKGAGDYGQSRLCWQAMTTTRMTKPVLLTLRAQRQNRKQTSPKFII